MPQEPGEVVEMVLQVRAVGLEVAGASNGDHVNETHQAGEENDENEHGDQVNDQQPTDAPEGSDEASNGDDEDDDTEEDEWPLEDLNAGIVLLGGEPDSGADDGD